MNYKAKTKQTRNKNKIRDMEEGLRKSAVNVEATDKEINAISMK